CAALYISHGPYSVRIQELGAVWARNVSTFRTNQDGRCRDIGAVLFGVTNQPIHDVLTNRKGLHDLYGAGKSCGSSTRFGNGADLFTGFGCRTFYPRGSSGSPDFVDFGFRSRPSDILADP